MFDVVIKPVEHLRFRSESVAIGSFRCPVTHPLYTDSGPCSHHTFVFPRTVTRIRHDGGRAFTGDPATVSFYNQHQRYTRTAVSPTDDSDWFVVADAPLLAAVQTYDPSVADRPERPFRFDCGPVDSATYLAQRTLFEHVGTEEPLGVEESVYRILDRILAGTYARNREVRITDFAREQVEEVRRILAADCSCGWSLNALAREVASSPFHLCRNFRAVTGHTVTAYRHLLRGRAALERLRDPRTDITMLALDLGYSSHSHFTARFRRMFGVAPSTVRTGRGGRGGEVVQFGEWPRTSKSPVPAATR
ncbi:MAG: AraC family transcriptional regulator [Acidobacteriota bacterium]